MFSVRIVDADFYVTKPTAELDVLYSEFRNATVLTRVPVIRIFGSTPSGQKTCLHVHQVFPYIFVPYDGTQPREKYLKQFATSIDFAVQVALGKATSGTNHVVKTEIVRRIPFYGYHEGEQEFIKIQFYNPRMVAKVVDLLQNGAILNKIFQPYESHIPYILQFFIDFNLYGMNLFHTRKVHFRGWSGIENKNSPSETGSPSVSSFSQNDSSSFHASATSWQNWNKHTIPSDLCLGAHVVKTSRCELEVDVIAEDILNQLEIGTSIGRNPGIAAMWEDEKQRRRDHGQSSQISIPVSQDRGEMKLFHSETEFKRRIHEIIQERNQMIQSQLEIMEKSLSPEEFQELSQSILLDGKEPCSQTVISQDVDENVPVVDESVIEASQSQPNSLSGHIDEELVAILLSLAGDPNDSQPQECSPKASQMIEKTESDNDDEESIIMSQPVWNDDDLIEGCESTSQSTDDDEEDWKPQRIPQLDGPADDDTPLPSNRSTSAPTGKGKKIIGNKERKSDDEDDFRIKKKPKISGKHNNISRTKRELTTRQRKAAIAQLNVVGGNSKHRERDGSCTIHSEAATSTKRYHPLPGSEIANWNDGKFPNLELFHLSSKPRRTNKGSLGPSVAGERRNNIQHKNEDHAKDATTLSKNKGESSKNEDMISVKSGISKKKKDKLLHLETESSGSQTSDFELCLSDSSSDGEDFKCKKKVPKITAWSNKIEGFYVAKQAPQEVNSKLSGEDDSKTYSLKSTIISQNRKSSSGNQTRISKKFKTYSTSCSTKQGCKVEAPSTSPLKTTESFGQYSEKDMENSRDIVESRKRKKTRSKKATCLMFTHVGNHTKPDKTNLSETRTSHKSDNCSLSGRECDKPKIHSKQCPRNEMEDKKKNEDTIHKNSRKTKEVKNEYTVSRNSENNQKENKADVSRGSREVVNEGKLPGNRILLDACIRLERVSVKPKNNTVNVLENSSQNVKEIVYLAGDTKDGSSKDFAVDEELDSLYQMAMLSPRSVRDDQESPPLPSSPSLNSDDQNLGASLFPVQEDNELNKSSMKQLSSLVSSDGLSADMKNNHITLDSVIATGTCLSLKPSTVTFPITFVREEEVKSITCPSADMEPCRGELNITSGVDSVPLSPGISAVCESGGSGDEGGTGMDMREHEVGICKDINAVSPGISVVCESGGSGDEGGTGMDMREHEVGICKDINAVSPGISAVCESGGSGDEGGTGMDMREHEVGICKDINAVSPGISVVCESGGSGDEGGTGMDMREHEVGICKDINAVSPGISAVCDSFSIAEKQTGLDIQEMLKDIESPRVLKSQESSGETNINTHVKDVESPGASEHQNLPGETYSKSHHDSKENNHFKTTTSLNEADDKNDRVTMFSDKLSEDGTRDKCHSMPQTTNQSHQDSEKHDEIWRPATEAPSPSYVLETRHLYGLPHERHQKAFCSDPKDIPSAARVIGGRRLLVPSLSVDELAEFDLCGNFRTLREFRGQTADDMDNSLLRDCLRSIDKQSGDDGYIGIPRELKLALMEDREVIITPVTLPPSPKHVREWMKERGTGNRKSQEPEVVGKGNDITQGFEKNKFPNEGQPSNTSPDENSGNSPKDNCNIPVSGKTTDVIHSPKSACPTLDFREMSQPVSRDILIGPQHSTPVGNPGMKSQKCWQCTPIEGDEVKFVKQEVKISREETSCKMKSLRRNILNSQIKKRDSQEGRHQPSPCEASYIEGPTPTNSFGFKISQPNIQEAKSVRQIQFLTLLSVELHVRTRKALRPDPEFDAICAIFYHIEHEAAQGKQYETGIIVVGNESTKLRNSDPSSVSTSSTSMETSHPGISKTLHEDSLIRNAGISNELNIITEHQETDAINRFIKLVHDWDPDILLGFEVQMLSWGYLIQRASALGIDLAPQLSRVQDSSGTARFDAEKDQWGASHTSEISITGRIVLNVWRLMRHEVTLNIYSFENISYHVLHQRIPLYTYRQLTRWWDQKLPHNRWRTVDHYITRCQGNIKILNHVDFINRTSEFARLYGILFYSVISRGSQFRVESMMLRLAKPMNYLAASPSIQQRARMDAPECIALVMEPESRFYTDPVIVLDFQSLYPSIIIAYNYCFSTCLGKVSRLDNIGNFDFGCTSLNVPQALLEKLEDDIHVSANGVAFVKPDIRRGILPRMVEEILDTRVMVKKAMKEHKNDKVLGQLLDARQLGLKLIANVTYGYTSANFSGRMPCVEIADAIVRKARETLERAIHLVNSREEWGARVVYGDTDSLFVLVKGATKEEAFQIGKEIVDAVTAQNPKPVKLKFEKVYLPCVLQTKKRYVGYMYETLEQKEPVFDAKGIETVRRDTCPAVAKILEKSLRILFEEKDISLVKKFVQRQFQKLMEERVSLQDFIFAKEYRGMKSYKPTACVPALALARRQLSRDRRAEPRVGERVPYVVVNGTPGLPLIQLVRRPGDLLEDSSLRLNSSYYINKQILPPLNRVFSLIGVDVFTWYTELPRYVPRHHVTTGKQKSSISRFFTTLHCPVCEQLTQQGLCRGCRDNPQRAVVILAERVGNWERKYSQLSEVCFQCCGTRDEEMTCVSLDCPVMFKRIKMRRNLEYGETLRDVQKRIEVTHC